jgi:hypothetical protein
MLLKMHRLTRLDSTEPARRPTARKDPSCAFTALLPAPANGMASLCGE